MRQSFNGKFKLKQMKRNQENGHYKCAYCQVGNFERIGKVFPSGLSSVERMLTSQVKDLQ